MRKVTCRLDLLQCWRLNAGCWAWEASALPLTSIPSPCTDIFVWLQLSAKELGGEQGRELKMKGKTTTQKAGFGGTLLNPSTRETETDFVSSNLPWLIWLDADQPGLQIKTLSQNKQNTIQKANYKY